MTPGVPLLFIFQSGRGKDIVKYVNKVVTRIKVKKLIS